MQRFEHDNRPVRDLILDILREAKAALSGDEITHLLTERGRPVRKSTAKVTLFRMKQDGLPVEHVKKGRRNPGGRHGYRLRRDDE